MTYLMFQNGYHQYEIFDFLNKNEEFWDLASKNVNSLRDEDHRFAPYQEGVDVMITMPFIFNLKFNKNNYINILALLYLL